MQYRKDGITGIVQFRCRTFSAIQFIVLTLLETKIFYTYSTRIDVTAGIEQWFPDDIVSIAIFGHYSSGNKTLSCNRSGIDFFVVDVISGIATFLYCSSGNVITSYDNSGLTSSQLDFIFSIAICKVRDVWLPEARYVA